MTRKSTLYPGSQLLLVVQVRLQPTAPQSRTHARQNSDELIEDLEHHLGGTTSEYLQVRLTYRHSGLPRKRGENIAIVQTQRPDGVATIETNVQTTATATIKRHNSASPWSSYPCALRPNPLSEIIALHWGAEIARMVMHHIINSRSNRYEEDLASPLVSASLGLGSESSFLAREREETHGRPQKRRQKRTAVPNRTSSQNAVRPPSTPQKRAAPLIPKRGMSLRKAVVSSPVPRQQGSGPDAGSDHFPNPKPEPKQATETRIEIRQASRGDTASTVTSAETITSRKSYRLGKIRKVSSAFHTSSPARVRVSTPPVTPVRSRKSLGSIGSASSRTEEKSGTTRKQESGGRKLIGCDGRLFPLTPAVVDVRMERDSQAMVAGKMVVPTGSAERGSGGKAKRYKERDKGWGWTGWW